MKIGLSLVLLFVITVEVFAQNGKPDSTFAINGKIVSNPGFPFFQVNAGVIQNDGRIIIAGAAANGNSNAPASDFFLTRFNTDGSVDNSFGNNGIVYTDISNLSSDHPIKLALLSDGRIVVAGMSFEYFSYAPFLSLARYWPDGRIDSSFNGRGYYFGKLLGTSSITDMQLHPNGKILVSTRYNSSDIKLHLFDIDGTPDNDFDVQQFDDVNIYRTNGVAWLPGGKILASGLVTPDGGFYNAEIFLARFNADGTIDSSFSTNGIKRVDPGEDFSGQMRMQFSPDSNKFYLSVFHTVAGTDTNRISILGFDTDGNAINSFGNNGVKSMGFNTLNFLHEEAVRIEVQPDGKLLLAGTTKNDIGVTQFSAMRLLPDGSTDNSFGIGGIIPGIASGTRHRGVLPLLQQDGKIIVAGYELGHGRHRLALARYTANGMVDNSFQASIAVGSAIRHDEAGGDIRIQPDGKILAAGLASNGNYVSLVLAKYHADGRPDSSFGTHGLAYSNVIEQPWLGYTFRSYWKLRVLSMANDSAGNIFVLSSGYNFFERRNSLTLIKLRPSGFPDSSFAHFGRKDFNVSDTQHDLPTGLAIQSDGKPVVAVATRGNGDETDSTYISIIRFRTDGTTDSSFGAAGIYRDNLFTGNEHFEYNQPRRMVIQPDGKILLCGMAKFPLYIRYAVHRYNANGSLDTQFNNTTVTVVPNSVNIPAAIALQPDGKILVAGSTSTAGRVVVRYTSSGNLDPTFGVNGIKTQVGSGYVSDIALMPNGRILVVGGGYHEDAAVDESFINVSRLLSNGDNDISFGYSGNMTIAPENIMQDIAGAMALQHNGRILICGATTAGWEDFYEGRSDLVIYGLTNTVPDCSNFSISAGADTAICFGGSALLGDAANTGVTYLWSSSGVITAPSSSRPTVSPLVTTQYFVYASSSLGCIAHDTVQVSVIPRPANPVITQNGNNLSTSTATSYQWYLNGIAIAGATAQTYLANTPGEYRVKIKMNNCESDFSLAVTVVTTGINSPELDKHIIIAPNPVDAELIVRYTGNFARFDIALLDLSGKQVFAKGKFSASFTLNMRQFSSGAYVVRVINASTGEQVHRLIMKK